MGNTFIKKTFKTEIILLRGNQQRGGVIRIFINPKVGKNLTHLRDLSSSHTQKSSVTTELKVEEERILTR